MNDRSIALQKIYMILGAGALPALDSTPRLSRESLKSLEEKLIHIFSEEKLSASTQSLVRSLVLLWHDYLDESHSISQNIHSADGSFLQGIMHRREPDYGNAKYWFHRVGEHPCFPVIARKVSGILTETKFHDSNLIQGGAWDPFAFIDACENALRKNDAASISVLQRIQEIEFQTLLDHFISSPTQ